MILENYPVRFHCRLGRKTNYSLSYTCPLTGLNKKIPTRITGDFETKALGYEWLAKHGLTYIKRKAKVDTRDQWRLNRKLLKQYNEYIIYRTLERERSVHADKSMLKCFVFPFFVTVLKLNDPNKWCNYGEEFKMWLLNKAYNRDGAKLGVGTIRGIITSANIFLRWMERRKYIDYRNFRMIENVDPRKLPKRNFRDLLTDENLVSIHDELKKIDQKFAEMFLVQLKTGLRARELIGLSFNWVSNFCPAFIKEEFESKGLKVYGSLYLESQPARNYIKRNEDHSVDRIPLKGRVRIGPEYSRTIPILDEEVWKILLTRYETQSEYFQESKFGKDRLDYLLFNETRYQNYLFAIQQACDAVGIERKGTHVLRHLASTKWASLKISDKVSEIVLGHKGQAHQLYVHIVEMINMERLNHMPTASLRKN